MLIVPGTQLHVNVDAWFSCGRDQITTAGTECNLLFQIATVFLRLSTPQHVVKSHNRQVVVRMGVTKARRY